MLRSAPYISAFSPTLSAVKERPHLEDAFWYGGALTLLEASVTERLLQLKDIPREELKKMSFEKKWAELCTAANLDQGVAPSGFYRIRSQALHHESLLSELDKPIILEGIPRILGYILKQDIKERN